MKRSILSILLVLLLATSLLALEESQITTTATASGTAVTGAVWFNGIIVKTDGSNNVTLNIYDGTGVTVTRLIPTDFVIPGTEYYFGYRPPSPIRCRIGIYVTIAVAGGGTASYQVLYSRAR